MTGLETRTRICPSANASKVSEDAVALGLARARGGVFGLGHDFGLLLSCLSQAIWSGVVAPSFISFPTPSSPSA